MVPTLASDPPPKSTVPEKSVARSTFSEGSSANVVEGGRTMLQRQTLAWSYSVSTVLATDAAPTNPHP